MGAAGSKEPATLASERGVRAGLCKGFATAGTKESATLTSERGSSTELPCRDCTTPRLELPGSVGLSPLSLVFRSARIPASLGGFCGGTTEGIVTRIGGISPLSLIFRSARVPASLVGCVGVPRQVHTPHTAGRRSSLR